MYSVQNYQHFYQYRNNKDNIDDTVKLYFTEARDAIRKHWQNTKLVILVYPIPEGAMEESFWQEIEKEGYTVIDLKKIVDVDLNDEKYKNIDKSHPSGEAWRVILPKVIDELHIK